LGGGSQGEKETMVKGMQGGFPPHSLYRRAEGDGGAPASWGKLRGGEKPLTKGPGGGFLEDRLGGGKEG